MAPRTQLPELQLSSLKGKFHPICISFMEGIPGDCFRTILLLGSVHPTSNVRSPRKSLNHHLWVS